MEVGELYQDLSGDFRTHTAEDAAQLRWNLHFLMEEWGVKA